MKQKTIWMLCLLIGTSILSCINDDVDDIKYNADVIYKNTIADSVRFEIYNSSNGSSIEYLLLKDEFLTLYFKGNTNVYPFNGNEYDDRNGDSVIIRFKDRYTVYTSDNLSQINGGDGVFDLNEYDNYSEEIIKKEHYTLRYSIDSTDYKMAIPFK